MPPSSFATFPPVAASCTSRAGASASFEPVSQSADVSTEHMQLVAQLENDYWHDRFAQAVYYVQGRGYDQYQPAYQLGLSYALQYMDGRFEDFARELEASWLDERAGSLLPWREVEGAVRDGWEHAHLRMEKLQLLQPEKLSGNAAVQVLQRWMKSAAQALAQIQDMRNVPMHDFEEQVLDRHIQLIETSMAELQPFVDQAASETSWVEQLTAHWHQVKRRFSSLTTTQAFDLCERAEQRLLAAYERALKTHLPWAAKAVLKRHKKELALNLDKLVWVRDNWIP